MISREGIENWFRIRRNLISILVVCTIATFFVFEYHIHDIVVLIITLFSLIQIQSYLENIYTVSDYTLTSLNSFKRIYSLNSIVSDFNTKENFELKERSNLMPNGLINVLGISTNSNDVHAPPLNGITVKIKPTERVAIIAENNLDQISFIKALLRLGELHTGRIEIDDIDISEMPLNKLWDKIGIISDYTPIFDSTLRHNIDPTGFFNDFEIRCTIKKAKLESLFKNLPSGLDTFIGKGGVKLSIPHK